MGQAGNFIETVLKTAARHDGLEGRREGAAKRYATESVRGLASGDSRLRTESRAEELRPDETRGFLGWRILPQNPLGSNRLANQESAAPSHGMLNRLRTIDDAFACCPDSACRRRLGRADLDAVGGVLLRTPDSDTALIWKIGCISANGLIRAIPIGGPARCALGLLDWSKIFLPLSGSGMDSLGRALPPRFDCHRWTAAKAPFTTLNNSDIPSGALYL